VKRGFYLPHPISSSRASCRSEELSSRQQCAREPQMHVQEAPRCLQAEPEAADNARPTASECRSCESSKCTAACHGTCSAAACIIYMRRCRTPWLPQPRCKIFRGAPCALAGSSHDRLRRTAGTRAETNRDIAKALEYQKSELDRPSSAVTEAVLDAFTCK
jgi:hypothetical protein